MYQKIGEVMIVHDEKLSLFQCLFLVLLKIQSYSFERNPADVCLTRQDWVPTPETVTAFDTHNQGRNLRGG
jgi:hypothetical protein